MSLPLPPKKTRKAESLLGKLGGIKFTLLGRISLKRQYSIENMHILKSRAPYPPPATGDRGCKSRGEQQHHHKNEGLWGEGKFHSSPGQNPHGQRTERHGCGWVHGCSPSKTCSGAHLDGQEAALHFCLALFSRV